VGIIEDVRRCVTMDAKQPGNRVFLVGYTEGAWGGTHFALVHGLRGGRPPQVNTLLAKRIFAAIHQAIQQGFVRACHDLSEGGLAVAAAEMAFAGGWGMQLRLPDPDRLATWPVPVIDAITQPDQYEATWLFAESNSRFLCEVPGEQVESFYQCFRGLPLVELGCVTEEPRLRICRSDDSPLIDADIFELKECWQTPLRW
jgi:phosphoribosylformylglycinamidine synthase